MEQYRKTPRADFLDYEVGDYFVTICTKGHKHFFGEITDNEIHLNELGMFCQRQLEKAHSFNDNIEIIVFYCDAQSCACDNTNRIWRRCRNESF